MVYSEYIYRVCYYQLSSFIILIMAGAQWPRALNKSSFLVIVISGFERFAFIGVASNLVTFLTDVVDMSNSSAAKMVYIWRGLTSILPLVLAPMAEPYWDRYTTIKVFSFIYFMGLLALTSSAMALSQSSASLASSTSFLFCSLCLISLGRGGYIPSLQAFGAEQLGNDEELRCSKDEKKSNKKTMFFQWWYFGICSGSLIGVTVMSYIQDTYGWVLGIAIPASAVVLSIVIFSCGSRIFTFKDDEAVNIKVFQHIMQAIKSTASRVIASKITLRTEKQDLAELELQEKPLCPGNIDSIEGSNNNPKRGVYVQEGLKVVLRLVPIWTMLLMFAVMFQQPATFFTKQGMTMKRNIGSSFKIPPATLQNAITISILLLLPFYDNFFIPIAQRVTRNEKGITVMQRMGVGMALSIIGFVIAAIVESKRLQISQKMDSLGSNSDTVPLSIFLLLPQYILLGISDIFAVVGMQEFFYSEVPVKMRTMGLALNISVYGVGSFVSALLVSLIELITGSNGQQSWFSSNMREARLDNYYWLLATLSTVSLLLYVILCKFYKSMTADEENCS